MLLLVFKCNVAHSERLGSGYLSIQVTHSMSMSCCMGGGYVQVWVGYEKYDLDPTQAIHYLHLPPMNADCPITDNSWKCEGIIPSSLISHHSGFLSASIMSYNSAAVEAGDDGHMQHSYLVIYFLRNLWPCLSLPTKPLQVALRSLTLFVPLRVLRKISEYEYQLSNTYPKLCLLRPDTGPMKKIHTEYKRGRKNNHIQLLASFIY